tara:strand:+ start:1201 stop:1683 length:483 start_codon:yes stop_codon:yes gene_type:complete
MKKYVEEFRQEMLSRALSLKRSRYIPRFTNFLLLGKPEEGELKEYGVHPMSPLLGIVYFLVKIIDNHYMSIEYIGKANTDTNFHSRKALHKKDKVFDKIYFSEHPLAEIRSLEVDLIKEHLPPLNNCNVAKKCLRRLEEEIDSHISQTLDNPLKVLGDIT